MINRRGFTLLEVTVASIIMAMMLTVCLQFFRATAAGRRAQEHRQTAIREAANLMERLTVRRWDELTPATVGRVRLSQEAREALPNGQLEIDLTESPEGPDAKRIAVLIRWEDRAGRPKLPVRLVAWKYRRIEDQ